MQRMVSRRSSSMRMRLVLPLPHGPKMPIVSGVSARSLSSTIRSSAPADGANPSSSRVVGWSL
jgi:hypothetical protein